MTRVGVHVLLQVHLHAVVVTFFLLRESVVLNVRVPVPVAAVHILAAQLFLKRIARLEAHELVQIEQNVEQHACNCCKKCTQKRLKVRPQKGS